MKQVAEMKKFVAREVSREGGSLERAYEICKDANSRKIRESNEKEVKPCVKRC